MDKLEFVTDFANRLLNFGDESLNLIVSAAAKRFAMPVNETNQPEGFLKLPEGRSGHLRFSRFDRTEIA